ncbi:nucleoporin NUP188 homolog [Cephus cinctus]|uniref:Nucleoporin NUP188 homolog n=1 Tax=Cephus cinctus TaxID=211228 RepID=A0AAJ7FD12_CEPCN|nr:nucleoporin NUP188 homolog [Cephus cinctus]
MKVEPMGHLPYCKGLWSVISGTTCRCDKDLVEDEIKNATELLQSGLSFFKKYSESSLQNVYKTDPPPRMYDLLGKLAPLLNLDAQITWDLVCNFMLYEYRNCAETFASQLVDNAAVKTLIEDIWNFYYSERITLIKCLKLMVEYRDNERHPYQKQFIKFFDEVLLGNLLKSVQSQIEALKFINPPVKSQLFTDEHLHRLYNNSLIEMRELLHIFTIILDDIHVPDNEFNKLYGSISGEPRRLITTKSYEDKEAVAKKLEEIQYSQVALLLVGLDVTKHNNMDEWVKGVRSSMRDFFEHKCVRDSSQHDGPLLLAWMLANYTIDPDSPDTLNNFRVFGIRAIQLGVFHYLKKLMDSEMIKEDTHYAMVVRNCVYNLLTSLCIFFDEDRIGTLNGVFDAVASVLRYPETAERFWKEQEQDGLWSLYKCAVELFPCKFEPLTVLATGLAGASNSSAKKILAELDDLPSVTLQCPRYRDHNKPIKPYERECTIHRNNFTIPARCDHETIESTSEWDIIIWRTKANYWDVFHHKIEQLFSQAGTGIVNVSDAKMHLPEHVWQGFKLLETLLKTDTEISQSMVIPTELSFEVINRFSYPMLPINIYKIVAECICISSKLILKYPEDILSRMHTEVYPRFNNWNQGTTEFAQAVSFDGGLIASWLSGIETIEHSYPVLTAYLDVLSNYLIIKHNREAMYTVEIPGMVFLLQGVLPKMDSWYFTSDSERINLWLKSMFCLHYALDSNFSKDDIRNKLQLIVAYSLLYLEPRHALLTLVRTGERALQNKMLTETDWISGKGFKIIKSVQLALSIVNRLLMFRKSLGLGLEERSPLEIALYTSPCLPNGLLIVPTIVNYLYVWFSPSLQAMAVRLLKKFAEGFSMSLLVCMGMDGTAIRETFASRLMSPTCSAEVKVAILELVAVCLERQPGLTEALFNIMHQAERKRIFPRPADEFLTQGCSQFLDLYLKRIFNEEDIIDDKLYNSTMGLFHAMWYHRNEILVNYFRKRTNFWTHLTASLFRELIPNTRGYSQLIDIITLELFKGPLPESDFSANLKKLVDKNQKYLERLARYVLDGIPEECPQELLDKSIDRRRSERPLYEVNLESWYHFIVTLTDEKICKSFLIHLPQAQLITNLALDSLSKHIDQPCSGKVLLLLASLSLRCVSAWKLHCIGVSQDFKTKLVDLIQKIVQSYPEYGKPLRQTLISLLVACIQLVRSTLAEDVAVLEYLLGYSSVLATTELGELKEAANDQERAQRELAEKGMDNSTAALRAARGCIPATLAISMVTQLLQLHVEHSKHRRASCMQLRQMIPELMSCVGLTLQRHCYFKFSRAALTALGVVARSPYNSHLINEDSIAKLWLNLIPPADLGNSMLDSLYDDFNGSRWRCQDWWPLYTLGLEFLTGLVISEAGTFYASAIVMFLGSHEYQLMEVSTLLRHTTDPLAADLIQSLVALASSLAVRPVIWNSVQPNVRETLIKCMYLAYDSTVNLLLRPRILKFIIDGISVESPEELQSCDERLPSGELKLLVNKLIVINTACAQSFIRFCPKLNTLIDTIYVEDPEYTLMADINFGPPQMSMSCGPRLTYGTIISSAQLFTQALHSRSTVISTTSSSSKDDNQDSAKREWERAALETTQKVPAGDMKKLPNPVAFHRARLSGYVTDLDMAAPFLSNPRLVKRPYDPLICENTILSRATALAPSSRNISKSGGSPVSHQTSKPSNPWFASMEENNTRLALEVNLMLLLCQALEGVKNLRFAMHDRQLIVREITTEMGVFFDFLEHQGTSDKWQVKGSLVDPSAKITKTVQAKDDDPPLPARLREDSTVTKVPVCQLSHDDFSQNGSSKIEQRLDEDIITTGGFSVDFNNVQFLPLMNKLLKSVDDSPDAT